MMTLFRQKHQPGEAFKLWSNLCYAVPFFSALYWHLWPTAVLSVCVIIFGFLYHTSDEKHFLWSDRASAYLLITTNFVLCFLGNFTAPYFWIALLFVALAFLYYFYLQKIGHYNFNHGMWHVYGALITLFSIFTYVF